MKRKAHEPDESVKEQEKNNAGKRLKIEKPPRPSRAKAKHCRTYSANRKSVGPELLEDMGVNLLEDASNDSTASSSSTGAGHNNLAKNTNINLVLKDRDTNIRNGVCGSTQLDITFSGLKPNPPKQTVLDQNSLPHSQRNTIDRLNAMYAVPSDLFLAYNRHRPQDIMPKEDKFHKMSDEIILLVFKWLPKCSLARCASVCKRWSRLVKDETLWKRVDLGIKTIRPGVLADVVSRGCVVLRLARSTISSPVFYPDYSSQISKLQYLDLSMSTINPNCLAELLKTCVLLKKLALENCDLNDSVCDGIGQNRNLDVLHLAMAQGLSPTGVETVLSSCTKLRELNVSWTDLSLAGLQVLTENLPSSIDRLCIAGYRDTLQDIHVQNICNRCPGLIELDLSDAAQLTADTISIVVGRLIRLESFSTSRCYGISPYSYLSLKKLHSLLCLNIYGLLGNTALDEIKTALDGVEVNQYPLSSVARPTIGIKRTSIWNLRVRD